MVSRSLTRPLGAVVLALLVPLAACKKEEKTAQSNQPGISGVQINTGPGSGYMAAPESDVTRYSDEGPEIGTVVTRRQSIVRKSADQASEILSRLGPGAAVNKKARHGPYYLVEFPFAPGQMRLGWLLQEDLNAPNPVATVTATTTATVTATATTVNGRPPPLKLPKR